MIIEANVYRRADGIYITHNRLTDDNGWRYDDEVQVMARDADDATLGAAIQEALAAADRLPHDEESTIEQVISHYRALYSAAGVRTERAFGKGLDPVMVSRDPDSGNTTLTPLVVSRDGGMGAWGGEVPVPPGCSDAALGRLCREAWDRGGVPPPSSLEVDDDPFDEQAHSDDQEEFYEDWPPPEEH